MKALVCQKNSFTSSRTGDVYYQLYLAKKDTKGVVRIVMSSKSNFKEIQPYFVSEEVYGKVEAGFIYDFPMVVSDSGFAKISQKVSDLKPCESF